MSEHTPGPWIAGDDAVFTADHGRVICTTWGVGGPIHRGENSANARLIAASPALLAFVRDHASRSSEARELVAKATGRTP